MGVLWSSWGVPTLSFHGDRDSLQGTSHPTVLWGVYTGVLLVTQH